MKHEQLLVWFLPQKRLIKDWKGREERLLLWSEPTLPQEACLRAWLQVLAVWGCRLWLIVGVMVMLRSKMVQDGLLCFLSSSAQGACTLLFIQILKSEPFPNHRCCSTSLCWNFHICVDVWHSRSHGRLFLRLQQCACVSNNVCISVVCVCCAFLRRPKCTTDTFIINYSSVYHCYCGNFVS